MPIPTNITIWINRQADRLYRPNEPIRANIFVWSGDISNFPISQFVPFAEIEILINDVVVKRVRAGPTGGITTEVSAPRAEGNYQLGARFIGNSDFDPSTTTPTQSWQISVAGTPYPSVVAISTIGTLAIGTLLILTTEGL